jgi:lysophospholipase L1-like esterase
VLGLGLYGVLRAEAGVARRAIGQPNGRQAPDATGWYGAGRPGPAITVALLGDSSAAGYGVDLVEETPGAHLASSIATYADRRVHLRSYAVVGAQSGHLASQLDAALADPPDLAVVLVGVNDITHQVLPATSIRGISEAVRRLRDDGVEVVVGTCPDLGTIRPIPPPLKQVARLWSRRLAAAQTIAVVEQGGRTVSLGDILGPEFDAAPALFFGPDRFHPSAEGYRALADVLLPSALAALGLGPDAVEGTELRRGEGLRPVAAAAVEAVRTPGTELDGVEVAGSRRGMRGLWVELRHRRRHPATEAEVPADTEAAAEAGHVSQA